MAFEPISYDELVELWRLLFPRSYTFPIENEFNGQGFDVFSQQARIFAEAAEAVAVTQQVYYKLPHSTQVRPQAMGGQKASGFVNLSRTAGAAVGSISLDPGTVLIAEVQDTRGNLIEIGEFTLTVGANIPPDGSVVTVPVECTRVGYQGNVAAGSITTFKELSRASVVTTTAGANTFVDNGQPDRFTPNMLGRYVNFGPGGANTNATARKITSAALGQIVVDGPALNVGADTVEVLEYEDLGIIVDQPDALSGGRHAWLDAIGAERGIYRQAGETDAEFVLRVCFLADTISPGAVERLCARILGPCGICCEITETGDATSAMAYDLPPELAPDIMSPWDIDSTIWDSLNTATRFLDIKVSCSNAGENGFAYDANPFAPVDNNAWGWPDGQALTPSPPIWDGFPADYEACVAAFVDQLSNVLAAGVGFQVTQDCDLECACEPAP